MIKRIKSWFKKDKSSKATDLETYLQITDNTTFNSYFQESLQRVIENEEKQRQVALAEIAKFHPVTQEILKDLDYVHVANHSYLSFTPIEVRKLDIGKIIDAHVQKAMYTKRVKDVIED